MKYYFVIAKCGHVGKRKYVNITFSVKAESKKEAVKMVIGWAKVKKQLKDSITDAYEVSYLDYLNQLIINKNDDYLHSHYKRECDICNLEIEYLDNKKSYKSDYEFASREERINYIFKKRSYIEGRA